MRTTVIARAAGLGLAALSLVSVAITSPGLAAAESAPSGYTVPTRMTDDGVAEYGLVGQGQWQVAGLINFGEPTVRVVYDQTVPGAQSQAQQLVLVLQSTMRSNGYSQPGSIAGLTEVGYTAHYDGVQLQVFGDNPGIDQFLINTFAAYGMPFLPA